MRELLKNNAGVLLGFLGLIVLTLISPKILEILLLMNLLAIIFHLFGQFRMRSRIGRQSRKGKNTGSPKVSVHVPCYNEPPSLVIQTLKCIQHNDYPNFEIIVIDNNTRKTHTWKPVSDYCERFSNIRFQHFDQLGGFKAGALNEALKITSEEAEYIFVLDADYCVSRKAIRKAVNQAILNKAQLVQFPQAYRNVSGWNQALNEEYAHYFEVFSSRSNSDGNALATGTLTLMQRSALEKLGGWKSQSITEDASLGIAFREAGFQTLFVNEQIGFGLMPTNTENIRKQRVRWMFGNIQSLRELLACRSLKLKDRLDCLLQLTAWINFLGIPILSTLLVLTGFFFDDADLTAEVSALISLNMGVFLIGKFLLFHSIFKNGRAFMVHISFLWEGAFCWWKALFGAQKPFVRTNKFQRKQLLDWSFFLLPALLLLFSISQFLTSHTILAFSFLIYSILLLNAALYLNEQMTPSKSLTLKLLKS